MVVRVASRVATRIWALSRMLGVGWVCQLRCGHSDNRLGLTLTVALRAPVTFVSEQLVSLAGGIARRTRT